MKQYLLTVLFNAPTTISNHYTSQVNHDMNAGGWYLEQCHPVQYNDLLLTGKLWTYLADLNEQAQNRLNCIIAQMKKTEGITEELKARDQLAWVGAMNSIRNRAEEIVRHELIYDAKEGL